MEFQHSGMKTSDSFENIYEWNLFLQAYLFLFFVCLPSAEFTRIQKHESWWKKRSQ